MSEWRTTTVGEVGEIFDGPHATPTRIDEGPYFLNIASLNQGRLNLTLSDHVSEPDFARWTKRVTPQKDDLLFSYETRLGEAALMPADVRACLGRRMALIRPKPETIHPQFFLYLYLGRAFQKTIELNTIHGATVNRIPLNRMSQWELQIPSLPEQKAIAEVLGALDDKIAANTRLAGTADDAASALLLSSLSSEWVRLDEIATIVMGSSPKGDTLNESGDGVPFYQGVRDFGMRSPSRRVFTTSPVRMASKDDVLVSVRAPVGDVNRANEVLCIGRGIAAVRSIRGAKSTLFHQLKAERGAWEPFEAEGTVFGSINRAQLHGIRLRSVRDEAADAVETELHNTEALISSLLSENLSLAATRDALLPKLMSGALRVKDAETIVEKAGA
ncbi:MAG TPA: hypothetical protein DIW46_01960 [Microbacterium sp.]|nr:hypothetical protein [Microbacterium sp.]